MSEAWAIALLSAMLTVMSAILGWIATELRAIRGELAHFVVKEDCNLAMGGHCDEIRNLWKETRLQGERIARLEK